MKVVRTVSEEDFDREAAKILISKMRIPGGIVMGLSTGRTTGAMHRIAAELYRQDPFDISGVTFFAIDEVTGIPDTNPWACRAKLKYELLDSLGVKNGNFLSLPCISEDYIKDGEKFIAELQRRGGIGFAVVGLGENGHVGFNQPGTPFGNAADAGNSAGGVLLSSMDSGLEDRIRTSCGLGSDVRLGGITLDLAAIMGAKEILLPVKGSAKAGILREVVNGPVTENVPASILQLHPDCTLLADSEALSQL